ncbi:hydroxymethylbilane synthase [Candidatus Raskinella chloraquaticus]|uniref:hydroxymethylbilane synthase n=1 Tax=Candidatus Raskinella chloraquaticus TaxID=1951219 RepID=UPI00378644BB
MTQTSLIRIGTRGSPLALAQARETRQRLMAAHGLDDDKIDIVVITTSGDRIQDRALAEAGGKGLFTKEIEDALLDGTIDLAVHSAKDMPTALPPGLVLSAYLPREDVRDALICAPEHDLTTLSPGARIGTASLRRQALIRRQRPDIVPVLLRGNVETRLRKLAAGMCEATLLALAGLRRLGYAGAATHILDVDHFPPAVGQGAIAIETRESDTRMRDLLAAIDDRPTHQALLAERAFLAVLEGSCRAPIAGHARIADGRLLFHGLVLSADGGKWAEWRDSGPVDNAAALGAAAGHDIRARAPAGVLGV